MTKPPVPTEFFEDFPRIEIDESEESPFRQVLRIGVFAADGWTLGSEGPYNKPQSPADIARGQIREALLHLLELGLIDIDELRLAEVSEQGFPPRRDVQTGEGETR